jgi:ABC-type dipeptide/oligopeptide/nickel transport system permease component
MPPLLKFLVRRLLLIPLTLVVITAFLYGIVMLTPARERAQLYLPRNDSHNVTEQMIERELDTIIVRYGLNDPFPVQYVNWLGNLLRGEWGWSPVLRSNVLDYMQPRMPITIELTLYAVLLFIPTGILSGVIASRRRNQLADNGFRFSAFAATSIPPFILGLMMISFFYVGLRVFAPGRFSNDIDAFVKSAAFHWYTGLATIDGLLNGRPDVTLDAFKHLAMPVLTLSALHWATVGRVTRAAMLEERHKEYVIAAEARGIPAGRVIWRHTLVPALTTSALSAAALMTGVYVIEVVFNFHGVSEMIVGSASFGIPDAASALGFAVYSVIVVLVVMFSLDVVQAVVDPRLRERLNQ